MKADKVTARHLLPLRIYFGIVLQKKIYCSIEMTIKRKIVLPTATAAWCYGWYAGVLLVECGFDASLGFDFIKKNQIKSSLYSRYYAEARNEWRSPSPRLSAWAKQLQKRVAAIASRWRRRVDLTGPGIERQTSRTDSVRLATELTACRFDLILNVIDFF